MWFRDNNGNMVCVLRKNFHTDTEYYQFIAKL